MGAFGDVSLADIARAFSRYVPAVVALAVILVALKLMPGGNHGYSPSEATSFGDRARRPFASGSAVAASSPPADASATPADASFATGTSVPFTSFSSSSTFSSSTFGDSSSFGNGPDADFTFAEPTFVTPGEDDTGKAPLTVASKRWSSRSSGTPLATNGVPAGTLPVGARAAQDDKLSFVRLAGDATALRLTEHPEGNRATAGPVVVRVCPITTSGWQEGEATPIGDVTYDTSKCVNGQRLDGGVWQFDMSSYSDPTTANGFALVPGDDVVDFQVAFKIG